MLGSIEDDISRDFRHRQPAMQRAEQRKAARMRQLQGHGGAASPALADGQLSMPTLSAAEEALLAGEGFSDVPADVLRLHLADATPVTRRDAGAVASAPGSTAALPVDPPEARQLPYRRQPVQRMAVDVSAMQEAVLAARTWAEVLDALAAVADSPASTSTAVAKAQHLPTELLVLALARLANLPCRVHRSSGARVRNVLSHLYARVSQVRSGSPLNARLLGSLARVLGRLNVNYAWVPEHALLKDWVTAEVARCLPEMPTAAMCAGVWGVGHMRTGVPFVWKRISATVQTAAPSAGLTGSDLALLVPGLAAGGVKDPNTWRALRGALLQRAVELSDEQLVAIAAATATSRVRVPDWQPVLAQEATIRAPRLTPAQLTTLLYALGTLRQPCDGFLARALGRLVAGADGEEGDALQRLTHQQLTEAAWASAALRSKHPLVAAVLAELARRCESEAWGMSPASLAMAAYALATGTPGSHTAIAALVEQCKASMESLSPSAVAHVLWAAALHKHWDADMFRLAASRLAQHAQRHRRKMQREEEAPGPDATVVASGDPGVLATKPHTASTLGIAAVMGGEEAVAGRMSGAVARHVFAGLPPAVWHQVHVAFTLRRHLATADANEAQATDPETCLSQELRTAMSAAAESASATSAYSRFHDSVVRTLLDMQCGGQTEADVGCGISVDVWVPDTVQGQSPPAGKLTGRSPSAALWDPQLLPLAQPGTMLELEGPGHFVPCSEAPSDAEDAVTLPDEGLQFNLWTKRKHEVLRQVCRASDAALGQLGAVRLRTVTFGEWRECDTQAERRALLRRKLAK